MFKILTFILPLKFICLKRLILLTEVGSSAEKIPRLEHYPSGDIILARGLDFRTAHGNRVSGWGLGGRKLQNLVESYHSSSNQSFRKPLAWFYCQFKARWVLELLAKVCPTRNSLESFL